MLNQIDILKKYNLKIRGNLGQHILLDPNVIRKIVDNLNLEKNETVLEIGPGLGAITREILLRKSKVIAVEKDKRFIEILKTELKEFYGEKFQIIDSDILKCDLENILEEKNVLGKIKVIGNLPYYISTPILFWLIKFRSQISKTILTIQKEVAQRLSGVPRTKDYGRLTLAVQFYGKVESLFDISASCFLPPPEVLSRVISLEFYSKKIDPAFEKTYLEIIKTAFMQRRKTFLPLLCKNKKLEMSKQRVEDVFEELGFSHRARGEELGFKEFLRLAREIGDIHGD